MKRTKAFLAALSALCVTFSAMVSVSAAYELQDTTGGQSAEGDLTQYGARIGDNYYEDWIDAIYHATGKTITVLQDYTDPDNFVYFPIDCSTFQQYKEFTLDLNGHTINLGNRYMRIWNDMKITDSSNDHSGIIIANHKAIEVGPGYDATLDGVTVTSENNPITKDDSEKPTYYGTIVNQGNLTINNSNVTGGYEAIEIDGGTVEINENSTIEGKGVDAIYIHDNGAKLTVNNGNIINNIGYFAIAGAGDNGSDNYLGGTEINIINGTISAVKGTAIYLPQYGEVKIEGGSITGDETAIEIESGKLNIIGGEFNATSTEFGLDRTPDHIGGGSIASGSAIAVVCRTDTDKNHEGSGGYYGNMDINISGGTFNGVCGIAKYLVDGKDEADSINNMSITGGTFTGTKCAVSVDKYCENNNFISGGTFNTDVTSYLADGTAYSSDNGEYTVYSATNKITGAGTYRTISNDGKYDQLTMVDWKPTTQTTALSDVKFNIKFSDNTTAEYKYINAGTTVTTDGIVRIGLIVTDIPAEINTTITTIQ